MRRHSTDAVSLVFGVIFVAIAVWWLIGRYVEMHIPNFGWLAAGALMAVGLLGIAGSLRRDTEVSEPHPTERDAVSLERDSESPGRTVDALEDSP